MGGSSCRSVGLGLPGETLLILPPGHETPQQKKVRLSSPALPCAGGAQDPPPEFAAPAPAVGHPGAEQVHVLMERTSSCVPKGWHGKCVTSAFGS